MNYKKKKDDLWKYAPSTAIYDANFDGTLERFYKSGISGLIRENIQNSLDGKIRELDKPVIVDIKVGTIKEENIPGLNEIRNRINSLKGYNEYTRETIKHMKNSVNNKIINYISFEDFNTRGLTGAKNGESDSTKDTWNVYAYKKGVHSIENNNEIESIRGGSHGIGKIASNSASDLYLMFFANCDDKDNKHLGGTIQLIEHEYKDDFYRATGYFTDIVNNKYMPFENKFSKEFSKNTRGLKIIIPFLRDEFNDEKEIIKSVCDSFFVSILEKKLIVNINNKILDDSNLQLYIRDQDYYEQNVGEIKDEFTNLYLDTYLNTEAKEIEIKSKEDIYKFKLYLNINREIKRGRLGIVRTIGMKIEDKKITNNATKPFNGVLIPFSSKEDSFLKMLENESHTEISNKHIKDEEAKSNALRFINNISRKIGEIVRKEIEELTPTDGFIDTKDIIYTVENKFKKDLEKSTESVKLLDKDGKQKQYTKDSGNKRKNKKGDKHRGTGKPVRRPTNITSKMGENRKQKRYNVNPDTVERLNMKDKEYIKFNLASSEIENKKVCDVSLVIVNGMGEECPNEFNISENYKEIVDRNTRKKCLIKDNIIKDVSIYKGIVDLEVNLIENINRSLKFVYYVEVY